ncbi:MAG: hypothetical protein IJ147_03950, partial [Lachnospiraceae bacterium]|nr:hypothetical protein [Lachnospiraceae bacterium]
PLHGMESAGVRPATYFYPIISVQSEINGDPPDMHLNFYVDIILLFLCFVNTGFHYLSAA